MVSRRDLLTAGLAGGLVGTADEGAAAAPAVTSQNEREMREVASAIRGIESSIDQAWLSNGVVFGPAAKVRAQFETYFRTNQKFPDFIDVGMSVFLDLYDWHIKNRQPLVITRGPDARYWMQFMFTTIILRGEHEPGYIGIPYDKA